MFKVNKNGLQLAETSTTARYLWTLSEKVQQQNGNIMQTYVENYEMKSWRVIFPQNLALLRC